MPGGKVGRPTPPQARRPLRWWLLRAGVGLVLVLGGLVLWAPETLAQCRMCATALGSPEGQVQARAFNQGILFLLAVPMTAIGTIAWLVARRWKRPGEHDPGGAADEQRPSARAA